VDEAGWADRTGTGRAVSYNDLARNLAHEFFQDVDHQRPFLGAKDHGLLGKKITHHLEQVRARLFRALAGQHQEFLHVHGFRGHRPNLSPLIGAGSNPTPASRTVPGPQPPSQARWRWDRYPSVNLASIRCSCQSKIGRQSNNSLIKGIFGFLSMYLPDIEGLSTIAPIS
jgi:hypothetical protein